MLDYANPQAWPERVAGLVHALCSHRAGVTNTFLARAFMPGTDVLDIVKAQAQALGLAHGPSDEGGPDAEVWRAGDVLLQGRLGIPSTDAIYHQAHARLAEAGEKPAHTHTVDVAAACIVLSQRERGQPVNYDLLITEVRKALDWSEFNLEKARFWTRWAAALGLGFEVQRKRGDRSTVAFYPYPVPRLLTFLDEIFGAEDELLLEGFRSSVSSRMPYMDGGTAFNRVLNSMGDELPPGRLTLVFETAMLELESLGLVAFTRTDDDEAAAASVYEFPALADGMPNSRLPPRRFTHVMKRSS